MSGLDWMRDAGDSRVVEALTRRCTICGAPVGSHCRSLYEARMLASGAIVHMYRVEVGNATSGAVSSLSVDAGGAE